MDDTFHFETQTVECKYCKCRVGVNFQHKHLKYCENESGREHYEPWWDDYRQHLAPLGSVVNGIKYELVANGDDATLDAIMGGGIGSFAEDRFFNTLSKAINDNQRYFKLKDVLELLEKSNCPLCHKNPCKCR